MKVQKAYAITDAKINFVSLVNKAANKQQFLITKAKDGNANFTSYGRIIKTDSENHYVTGIVYEPMIEDAHGNYMTEDEIIKAAYWFAKNGDQVDLQHSFEALEKADVVETWVAKSDTTIGDIEVKKGTWLMTVEVSDADVWESIEKGELTGFSMGGVGKYSTADDDLGELEKAESKGLFQKLAKALGFEVVEKGAFLDSYNKKAKSTLFWNAWYSLEDLLYRYNWMTDRYEFEADESNIREALQEFTDVVAGILSEQSVTKALTLELPVEKAGKKLSGKNRDTLQSIYDNLGSLLTETEDKEEDIMKDEDVKMIQKMIDDAVAKASPAPAVPAVTETPPAADPVLTADSVQKMVEAAISKALTPEEEPVTAENIAQTIEAAVAKAMEPVLKAKALPTNLNGGAVEKSEPHYMSGLL